MDNRSNVLMLTVILKYVLLPTHIEIIAIWLQFDISLMRERADRKKKCIQLHRIIFYERKEKEDISYK